MDKLKIFFLAITPLIIFLIVSLVVVGDKTSYFTIKNIVKNVKVFDTNIDHCHNINVIEDAKKQNVEISKIVINFDTHSDLYIWRELPKFGSGVEDWLNEYFAKFEEPEVLYWVLPNEEMNDPVIMQTFVSKEDLNDFNSLLGNIKKDPQDVNINLDKKPYVQYLRINTENGVIDDEIIPKKGETIKLGRIGKSKYKIFKLVNCTKETLPTFHGENIFLSVDMDYISNSGYDTINDFETPRTPKEMDKGIYQLLKTIEKKNVKPSILTFTLSRYYLPKDKEKQTLKFFKKFIAISGKKDTRKKYTRSFYNWELTKFEVFDGI